MPIVFKAVMPHGEELLPHTAEDAGLMVLRRAMAAIGRAFRTCAVDLLLVASPHHLRIPGHLAIADTAYVEGELASYGRAYGLRLQLDRAFNRTLADAAAAAGLPAARVSFQTTEGPLSTLPLDFGSIVPLHFLAGGQPLPRLCLVGPPRDLGLRPLVRLGEQIAMRSGLRRVALIASADLAHAHLADGPYGLDPAAASYDALVQAAALAGDLSPLARLPIDFLATAKPDAPWQLAILQGAMAGPHAVHDFAYARPSYFGMLAARFEPL